MRQIIQMRRTHGAASDWFTLFGEAARSAAVRPVAPPLADLSDPALYLDFSGETLDYAVFPDKSRRPMAIGSDVTSQTKAWA